MVFGARLGHVISAWDVHVDGLVQVLGERRAKGVRQPEWFCDFLAL